MLPLCGASVSCHVKEGIKSGVENVIDFLVDAVVEAVGGVVAAVASGWVLIPTPNLTGGGGSTGAATPGDTSGIETLLGYTTWISLGICVASLIVLGAMMALSRSRGEGAGHLGKIGTVLVATVLISAASSIVTALIPASQAGSEGSEAVSFLQRYLWWYVAAGAVLSVIIGAARMAWEQRAAPGKELVKSLITLTIVSAAGVTGIQLAVSAADGFATWILPASANEGDFKENITQLLLISNLNGLASIAAIILGLVAIFVSMIQAVLMVIRGGMLVILTGIFPLAAAFTNTEMGKNWFKKCMAWLIAFILYKPAAAIVYAAAFRLTGSGDFSLLSPGQDMLNILTGVTLMIVALLALPALMRFVTPMVGSMASGSGGAALEGMTEAGGQVATGAVRLTQEGAGGGSGGGQSSPSGAAEGGSSGPSPQGSEMSAAGGQQTAAAGGQQAATAAGGSAAGGGAAGGAAAGGAAAGGGAAAAGAAAGPAGLAVTAGVEAAKGAAKLAKGIAEEGVQGPDGSA